MDFIQLSSIVVLAVSVAVLYYSMRRDDRLPLAPGPPRRFLVGNLLDFPKSRPWETFHEWAEEHGDIMLIDLPFKPVVVLSSAKAAEALLDGRSDIYSDRPYSAMMDLLSWGWAISVLPYGSQWRTYRRYFHEHFSRSRIPQYHQVVLQQTRTLLTRILQAPEHSRAHIRSLTGSSIIEVVYGAENDALTQEYVHLADQALMSARDTAVPGAFLVELVTILKHVPGWLPGGKAQRYADKYRPIILEMRDRPFNDVKDAVEAGRAVPSVAYNLMTQIQEDYGTSTSSREQEIIARDVAGMAYAGAADTASSSFSVVMVHSSHLNSQTTASAESFILAMAMFPEVQKKAQAELEHVVGMGRLPDFNDLPALVYLNAVVLETVRWMPTIPLGVPHYVKVEDECNGYRIPKGSIVIPNAWTMLRNPEDYPEPEKFKPERFIGKDGKLDSSVRDPTSLAFGFGRRACPGMDFALSVLSIYAASMLHVYDIQAGVDESGRPFVLSSRPTLDAFSPKAAYDVPEAFGPPFSAGGTAHSRGDVLFIDLPFKPIVVLNSAKAATDLLDGRSHVYSDRPYSPMFELLGIRWALSILPYGTQWRTYRRYFHDHFHRGMVPKYHPVFLKRTRVLLANTFEDPKTTQAHIRSLMGSSIIEIVYGTEGDALTQEYVELADSALEAAQVATKPGAFLAELIPILTSIPGWLPGGSAQRFANIRRPLVEAMRDRPFQDVKNAMSAERAVPCVAYNLITQIQDEHGATGSALTADQETIARDVAGVAYAGASETTTAKAEAFVLAMAMFPEVQRRAQAELDRVVGASRLPDFNDLSALTYLQAVIMENLRWMPTLPLGVPHFIQEEDEYEGFRIPKGSVVISNIWRMLRNPQDYPDPEQFKPERFIGADGRIDTSAPDPSTLAFGFGRRVCPGQDFALRLLTIYAASILHVFDIQSGLDDDGQSVALSGETSDDGFSHPVTFPRHFKPRSDQAERLIRELLLEQEHASL
ncbi:hypothetical protein EIP91_010011 [Steccherinum ochraceum]|uniref:Cytochrome P450 n=1 Tax=Steccherinum ochraceum TaxID=92696 RepID=A0A4V2MX41_9APHY|nr:hypothetical protein EIP91_010011 [Steccherinum ochraceum]